MLEDSFQRYLLLLLLLLLLLVLLLVLLLLNLLLLLLLLLLNLLLLNLLLRGVILLLLALAGHGGVDVGVSRGVSALRLCSARLPIGGVDVHVLGCRAHGTRGRGHGTHPSATIHHNIVVARWSVAAATHGRWILGPESRAGGRHPVRTLGWSVHGLAVVGWLLRLLWWLLLLLVVLLLSFLGGVLRWWRVGGVATAVHGSVHAGRLRSVRILWMETLKLIVADFVERCCRITDLHG